MIRNLGPVEVEQQSLTCDKCGVLIGTMQDFHFNDDYQAEENEVTDSKFYCGRCRL
jgi:hypothetical protein